MRWHIPGQITPSQPSSHEEKSFSEFPQRVCILHHLRITGILVELGTPLLRILTPTVTYLRGKFGIGSL